MTVEADLKSLVETYAKFNYEKGIYISFQNEESLALLEPSLTEVNQEHGIYIGAADGEQHLYFNSALAEPNYEIETPIPTLSDAQLFRLQRSFSSVLNQWLLHDGAEKERIEENYQKLQPLFDMSAEGSLSPELLWLEHNLSKGFNDGVCKQNLIDCYQKLVTPQNFKELKFKDIANQEDLKKWLETLSLQARTYNERSLYNSLLGLLNESTGYYDEVGKIKPVAIKTLLSFIPVILVSLGTLVFAEELLSIYALYFIVLKGGQYISKTNISELQAFGHSVQKVTSITAATTTALLVRLMELIFWSSCECYMATLQVGSAVIEPFFSPSSCELQEKSLEQDLIKAGENKESGLLFRNYQLKLIVAPLEARCSSIRQQYFLRFRTGEEKDRVLNRFLTKIREVDQNRDPIEIKLEAVQRLIGKMKENTTVYYEGSETWTAINKTECFLKFFIANPLAIVPVENEYLKSKR